MMFQVAERKRVKLKIAMTGPSGSGKTYSSLLIAKGLGDKIALIDTENGSGSLYAGSKGIPTYSTMEMAPPFLSEKYIEAINAAVKAGFEVLIIDSISHQWSGEGGIMDRLDKAKLASRSKNSYTLWSKFTPEHERFKQAILQAPIHVIATMRSKQDYVMEANDQGKQAPRKVGLAPIQRDQVEYEFTTVFDMSGENHFCTVSKDRTNLFDGQNFRPSEETGQALLSWVNGATKEAVPVNSSIPDPVRGDIKSILVKCANVGIPDQEIKSYIKSLGVTRPSEFTQKHQLDCEMWIENQLIKRPIGYQEQPWEKEAGPLDNRYVK